LSLINSGSTCELGTLRARYSRHPAFRPSGRASHVLICSRQISQPLSHLSETF
jgi:hypothetical protein